MKIFDCDVAYGRGAVALAREIETPDDLLAELDHSGIAEALVWHRDAYERDFDLGNRRLAEIASRPRLHRTMTFVPPGAGEIASAADLIERMRAEGVRVARAFPAYHYFCLDRTACGELLDLFSACRVPLIVPLSELPNHWGGVYALLRDFPRLTLILTETGCWGQDRYFRALMKAYPGFHITTNRLETAGQLKSIVDALGPEHLLFGSGLPRNYPGGYVLMLARADISDDAREAVAHGNIERLLEDIAW